MMHAHTYAYTCAHTLTQAQCLNAGAYIHLKTAPYAAATQYDSSQGTCSIIAGTDDTWQLQQHIELCLLLLLHASQHAHSQLYALQ